MAAGRRRGLGLLLLAAACQPANPPVGAPAPRAAVPPAAAIETTVWLIGDAGAPAEGEPVLAALTRLVREHRAPHSVILYLGDNAYPRGLPDTGAAVVPSRKEVERRLLAQIDVAVQTRTKTFFIPGNHDWAYMTASGWDAVRRQGEFIAQHGGGWAELQPTGGCPGPVTVDVGAHLRLVMLDTQWWLHDYARPLDPDSGCPTDSPGEVVNAMNRAMLQAGGRQVLVAGHHPLASGGLHGGHFTWLDHLFPLRTLAPWLYVPLPVIGTYYVLNRQQGASNQDLAGPENQQMRRAFEMVFSRRRPLVYASGHDHDLQVLEGKTVRHILVSGAGIYGHESKTSYRPNTRWAASLPGFMRLDVLADGRVRLGVITVGADSSATERYAAYLK